MRHRVEYVPVWCIVKVLGLLPRCAARRAAIGLAQLVRLLHPRLARVAIRNLQIAYPQMSEAERQLIVHGVFTSLGRLLAEFCLFPRYTRQNANTVVVYDGFENYAAASAQGKGVLLMTAHLGAWELGSFYHSLMGHPIRELVRQLDNPYLDKLVEHYRTLHGNRTVDKDDSIRAMIKAMRAGETVGVLMDVNMVPPHGVFVPFFGVAAYTAASAARVAAHTGCSVVPAFTVWDETAGKYRVRFEPALQLIRTDDPDSDMVANTALFTSVTEKFIREYPDQWLWVHRRWKTRPEGEKPLY
jgi:KDO2-lipid IV(A) lauroyltransferase